jgi:DNA polymerase-3 subunit epsilon
MPLATPENDELNRYAQLLAASGDYRILKRFEAFSDFAADDPSVRKFRGVFLDVETTGVDPAADTIIELAMVPFEYSADGRIFAVGQAFQGLNDPGRPLPAEITLLTGITDEMVRGHRLDPAEVAEFLNGTQLVIAHNAAFDRVFFENFFPALQDLRWACSLREVPWSEYGVEGHKLEYIAYRAGVFFEGHRAEVDCHVALPALALTWPGRARPALADLRENALAASIQLWAVNSPFESKDLLKARGYRWNGELRSWHVTLPETGLATEKEWLAGNVYQQLLKRGPVTLRAALLDGTNRYRADIQPDRDIILEPA